MKGHSATTKQCKDGRVDSLQTLHNLEEGLVPAHNFRVNFLLILAAPHILVPYYLRR